VSRYLKCEGRRRGSFVPVHSHSLGAATFDADIAKFFITCCVLETNFTAFVGDPVTLPCGNGKTTHAAVDWYHQSSRGAKGDIVISADNPNGYHGGRPEVNKTTGALIIYNVQTLDAGFYTCHENQSAGRKHPGVVLTVQRKISEQVFVLSMRLNLF